MKIATTIILISISLCGSMCCAERDNFFYNEVNINNDDIVQIENNTTSFNVNENIVIETNLLNEQITENNQSVSLTDFYYEDSDPKVYRYSLTLYKENAFGTISEIPLTLDNINSIEGETSIVNGNAYISCIYDGTSFKNKFSINLPEAGTFYLASERFLVDNNGELRISGGVYELGNVKISSIIVNANSNGAYEFTVN